jgi:hypothetical protein
MKKRLGEILIERRIVTVEQLDAALAHQRQWGMRLGSALVAKGFIAEGVLTRVLSESLQFPMVDLSKVVAADKAALDLVPIRVCEQYDVFPIALKPGRGRRILLLAMADPLNVTAIDEIAFATGCTVQPAIAQISSVDFALRKFYYGERVEIPTFNFERTPLARAGAPSPPPPSPSPPPLAAAPIDKDVFSDQPTGTFVLPPLSDPGGEVVVGSPVLVPHAAEQDASEGSDERFWALMRVLERRGLVTRDEYLAELRWREKP